LEKNVEPLGNGERLDNKHGLYRNLVSRVHIIMENPVPFHILISYLEAVYYVSAFKYSLAIRLLIGVYNQQISGFSTLGALKKSPKKVQ